MRRPLLRLYLNDLVEGVGVAYPHAYPHAYHNQIKEDPKISLGRYYQKLHGIVGERMGEEGGEE